MSIITTIKTFIAKITGSSTVAAAVVTIVETDMQKLVAYLKTTTVGTAAVNAINDAASTTLSGTAKFEQVVADIIPVLTEYLTNAGALTTELSNIEDVARELVQSAYNDTISTVKTVIKSILSLLGID